MTMVARNIREQQSDYFMLPSRGGTRNKFASGHMPSGPHGSGQWGGGGSGGLQLPALEDSHHHQLSSQNFSDSLLESVSINHHRPSTTTYSPPPPGGKFFTPTSSFPSQQLRAAAGGSRGGDTRESMGAGFYRPRTVAKPGDPMDKRAPLRPSTQPHGLGHLNQQQHGKPFAYMSPSRGAPGRPLDPSSSFWGDDPRAGVTGASPASRGRIEGTKKAGALPKVHNPRHPGPARQRLAQSHDHLPGAQGVRMQPVGRPGAGQMGGTQGPAGEQQQQQQPYSMSLPMPSSGQRSQLDIYSEISPPREVPGARERGLPFGRSTMGLGVGKFDMPRRQPNVREKNAWGQGGSSGGPWLSPSRGVARDNDLSPFPQHRMPDNALRGSAPSAAFDGSSAPLMNLKSKMPRHSPAPAGAPGQRTRSRPMEASKRAAYSKDAKRRVGGLSTVLAMTEPTGPLPSSLPEGAPIPVATVPGALAPLGALHSQVGPASSLSAVGTSLSTPSPSELPPFPEPEPEPEPEEPEKMEAEEEGQGDEAMSEAGSSEAEETVMVVPEPTAEEEVTSPMEEEEEVGPQGLSPEVGDVVDPETRTRVLAQRYEVQKVVGEGAYGLVMKCKMRGSDTYVAIKEFKIEEDDPDADDVRRTSKREVDLLRNLQHPHVVGFIEEFYVKDKLFIVMEFVPCNLLEVLESHNGGLDKDMVRSVIYQLVKSIDFIHQKDIVYRDIKPENLLVTETGQVKLCDFGFARYVTRPDETLTDYVATRWYRAPELLLGPPWKEQGKAVALPYGGGVDMWAIGCLMGELMDGEPLFAGDSDIDQLYKIQKIQGNVTSSQWDLFRRNPNNTGIVFNIREPMTLRTRYEGKLDEVELDFLEGLLQLDPEKRLTSSDCLKHPYLADMERSLAG